MLLFIFIEKIMWLDCRICVATWNVGGKTPDPGLNLEDFLQVEDSADIYVCGYDEHAFNDLSSFYSMAK